MSYVEMVPEAGFTLGIPAENEPLALFELLGDDL